jgi:hypothetical protein
MATTTNYSWSTPDDTALVKDGAAAIRSLGTAIDTTVFTNAGAAIAKATVDAKGDLIAGTADNTVARLAVGTDGHILVADSVEATGLKWAAPAGGGKVLQVVQSLTTGYLATTSTSYTDANLSATITPSSATSKILVIIMQAVRFYTSTAATPAAAYMTILRDSTAVWNTAQTEPYVGEFEIAGGGQAIQAVANYLDSPATTSAITYKPQYKLTANTNSRTLYLNYGGNQSNIILMEIGA